MNHSSSLSLANKGQSHELAEQAFLNRSERTQKIVTALYLITDYLGTDEPLVALIKRQAAQLLEELFTINTKNTQQEKKETLLSFKKHLHALLATFDIMGRTKKISEMNYSLVREQIVLLEKDSLEEEKNLPEDVIPEEKQTTLNYDFFDGGEHVQKIEKELIGSFSDESLVIKDNKKESVEKDSLGEEKKSEPQHSESEKDISKAVLDTEKNNKIQTEEKKEEESLLKTSGKQEQLAKFSHLFGNKVPEKKIKQAYPKDFYVKQNEMKSPYTKEVSHKEVSKSSNDIKEKRHGEILDILKKHEYLSITDICDSFTQYSSKTIQRDLIELIDNGRVIKKGERRWSTYSIGA